MNKKLKYIKKIAKNTEKNMVSNLKLSDNMNKDTNYKSSINKEKDINYIKNITKNSNKNENEEKSKEEVNEYYKESNEDINNEHLDKKKYIINGDSFKNIKNVNHNTLIFEDKTKELEHSVDHLETKLTNNKTNIYLDNKEEDKQQEREDIIMKNSKQLKKEKKNKRSFNVKSNEKMNYNNIEFSEICTNEDELDSNYYDNNTMLKSNNMKDMFKPNECSNINYIDSNDSITDEKKKLKEFVNNKKETDEDYVKILSFMNNYNGNIVNLNNNTNTTTNNNTTANNDTTANNNTTGNNNTNNNINTNTTTNNNNTNSDTTTTTTTTINNNNNNNITTTNNNDDNDNKEAENNKSKNDIHDIYIRNIEENNDDLNLKKVNENNIREDNKCNHNIGINNEYNNDDKNNETNNHNNEINKKDNLKNIETLNIIDNIKNEDSILNEKMKKFINDDKKKEIENLNMSDTELLKTMNYNNIPQNCEYEEVLTNIIQFNKDKVELNLNRGEIYLNESEYTFTSYFLLSSGFRFYPIEEIKKKKRKEFLKIEELNDMKRRVKCDNKKWEIKKEDKFSQEVNEESNNDYVKKEELIGKDNINKNMETNYENIKNDEKEDNIEEKKKNELFDEILTNLKNDFYNQILNIENNFKNLDNKIENNNSFNFHCIMEKLKNRKYNNVLYIYNDIYLYLNNLLYLSKPSSYIWMKLHELSTQITNTIYNIQQKKEHLWNKKMHNSQNEEINEREKKKEEIEIDKQKNDQSINEEEKMAFQLLLSKLHQDIHFELFRKFKNKAVWKTLEGGEIELDDKSTKAYVFRDMYKWCKAQLDIRSKKSDASESDSSKDSY
ncbi:conserved Plasmodium protein, unknown function [Plasmodium gallinaceum]|uniref:Uncharacterized protein n=1 Tax=Plasmodium gallinaceum TaxID=5849 RepID=A0A1J1GZ46_PLAGA|nr:conserved Plasmodium protein, unknown function [Plasmodium gallinaceum]CRG96291.1 conserved Plasmodium protein, unknown function [Plasmodium gallinaceum]